MSSEQTQNVVNAFRNVIKVYEETSFLLKSFADVLASRGMIRESTGRGIVTNTSKSIDQPKQWLPLHAGWNFWPKGQKENFPNITVMVVFCSDDEDVQPYLVVGVVEKQYIAGLYHQLYKPERKQFTDPKDGIAELPGEGIFKTIPLLQVSDEKAVEELAEWVVGRWEERNGKIK